MKKPAPVTRAIIIGNVGVAVLDVWLALGQSTTDSIWRQMLALSPAYFLAGAWWEPFTYMWLHAPPVGFWVTHILFNMMTLWIFGKPVEARLGSTRFSILYLAGGLAAGAAFLGQGWWMAGHTWQGWQADTQEIVGASGAVLAVVAAFAVYFPDARLFIFPCPFPVKASKAVGFFILLSLILMFIPALSFIGHSAHIGGLLAGYVLALHWRRRTLQPPILTKPAQNRLEEMAASLEVAQMSEVDFRARLKSLLHDLGGGRWRPLSSQERALLRRAHLLV